VFFSIVVVEISASRIIRHVSVFWWFIYLSVAVATASRSLNESDCPMDLPSGGMFDTQ
jgi:hypothetical protein